YKITDSMQYALDETQRRRDIHMANNEKYGITPKTINTKIHDVISATVDNDETHEKQQTELPKKMTQKERHKTIDNIEK
ncbi:excinuclease ABC subunit B, partial [Staphylococcus haemolyticus]